jgi:hypothetical protein
VAVHRAIDAHTAPKNFLDSLLTPACGWEQHPCAIWQAAGRQPAESEPVGAARQTGHAGLYGRLPRKLPQTGRDPDADHARDRPQAFSALGGDVVTIGRRHP